LQFFLPETVYSEPCIFKKQGRIPETSRINAEIVATNMASQFRFSKTLDISMIIKFGE
jgi:hypothetical protein